MLVLVWSGIGPKDYPTWVLEVLPAVIGFVVIAATYRSLPLTPLLYALILLHCVVLMVGGHYTYAEVPLFDALKPVFGFERNHYDKVGHFMQGFVPALIAREILIRNAVIPSAPWRNFFIVCFCLAFSALYELIEWAVAEISEAGAEAFLGTQGWVWDTQSDMAFALGGAMHRYRQSREPDSGSVSGDPTTGTPAPLVGEDEEEWSEPGLDSRLVLHGELASGEAIAAECEVSRDAINLVIGRSEAELPIESAAVSRVHARLSGTSRELTITDLGSNNGTSINGVPCLEGEIMYVGPDDVIITGDARFTVTIQPVGKDADGQ